MVQVDRMFRNKLKYVVLLFVVFQLHINAFAGDIKFKIISDFPKDTVWIKKLLHNSAKELNTLFAHEKAELPKQILVTLKKDMRIKGIASRCALTPNPVTRMPSIPFGNRHR